MRSLALFFFIASTLLGCTKNITSAPPPPNGENSTTSPTIESELIFQGNEGGHGGGGWRESQRILLLDLLEGGLQNLEFQLDIQTDPNCLNASKVNLHALDGATQILLCKKIAQIRQRDALLAEALIFVLEAYDWTFVDYNLNLVEEFKPLLSLPPQDLVQIATRTATNILVSNTALMAMPITHRIALIIHELIYSLIPRENNDQKMMRVRELTAFLFSDAETTSRRSWDKWKSMIADDLPIIEMLMEPVLGDPGPIILSEGTLPPQMGYRDPAAYNQAETVTDTFGNSIITFAPTMSVKLLAPLSKNSTMLSAIEHRVYPVLAVKKDMERATSEICQLAQDNQMKQSLKLNYYQYQVEMIPFTSIQSWSWEKAPEAWQYFADIIYFVDKASCAREIKAAIQKQDEQYWQINHPQ